MAFLGDRPYDVPKGRQCHGDRQSHLNTKDPADVPGLAPGPHRDQKMSQEAGRFEKDTQHGLLRKTFELDPAPVNHLRTYDHAKGDHDVLNPLNPLKHTPTTSPTTSSLTPKKESKSIVPRLRHDVELEKLHHQHDVGATDRANVINKFSLSPGLVQNLSPQPVERLHKVPTEIPHGKHPCPNGVEGFSKMGTTTNEGPSGRHIQSKQDYDPKRVQFPLQGETVNGVPGLRNSPQADLRHQNNVANWNDRSSPSDVQGFDGMKSQIAPPVRGLGKHAKTSQPPEPKTKLVRNYPWHSHGGGTGGTSPPIDGFRGMGSFDKQIVRKTGAPVQNQRLEGLGGGGNSPPLRNSPQPMHGFPGMGASERNVVRKTGAPNNQRLEGLGGCNMPAGSIPLRRTHSSLF